MCIVVIPFILDVRLVDAPVGVAQEEGHTGFLHLPSAVLALICIARKIQPFLSLVDRNVEFCVLTNQSFSTCWAFLFYFIVLFVEYLIVVVTSQITSAEFVSSILYKFMTFILASVRRGKRRNVSY